MLLVAAERDARVEFTQSVRFLARLRRRAAAADAADDNDEPADHDAAARPAPRRGPDVPFHPPPQMLLLRGGGGHFGEGGRYRRLEQAAVETAFLLSAKEAAAVEARDGVSGAQIF
jgi:hypothetical protein